MIDNNIYIYIPYYDEMFNIDDIMTSNFYKKITLSINGYEFDIYDVVKIDVKINNKKYEIYYNIFSIDDIDMNELLKIETNMDNDKLNMKINNVFTYEYIDEHLFYNFITLKKQKIT